MQCSGSMGYPIVIFLAAVLAVVVRFFLIDQLDTLLKHLGSTSVCQDVLQEEAKDACYGNQFVYREGFALVLFFSLIMLLVACCRKAAHDGMWLPKIAVIVATFIGSLWIGDDAMAGFAVSCMWGSGIFIFIQVLILLEWVYAWNEDWRTKAQEDESFFKYLLAATVAAYLLALTFIVLSIVQFGASGCSLAIAQISWTCVACFLFSMLSISGIADHGSLLCSSMMTLYCCFYCWSALTGMAPDARDDSGNKCNTLLGADGSDAIGPNVIFGLILTCFALAGSAYSSGTGDLGVTSERTHSCAEHPQDPETGNYNRMEDGEHGEDSEAKKVEAAQEWGGTEMIQPLMTYHFVMVLCSMYMVMTIVNWDTDLTGKKNTLQDFGTGTTVVWVKIIAQWAAIVLYIWTLIAPRMLTACGCERDFEFA